MPQPTWQTHCTLLGRSRSPIFGLVLARTWPRDFHVSGDANATSRSAAAFKAARAKIEAAKTDADKANALCEAADACALAFGRSEAAASYYLRAMRLIPASADLVERAIQGLEHRPRALESLLWRKLGADPEHAPSPEATRAALWGSRRSIAGGRVTPCVRARSSGSSRR